MSRRQIEAALERREEIETRWRSLLAMAEKSREAIRVLEYRHLRELFEVRSRSLEMLPRLLETLSVSVSGAGGHLYVAKTAEDARRYIAEIAASRNVRLVIKSKTMTGEEIGINQALESLGVEVVETDLGERVVQLAGHRPTHIIAPAVHLGRREIASLIRRKVGSEVEEDPTKITNFFRSHLWQFFKSADMGVTGANIVVAETGHVVLVTNEGNGRLVATMPRIVVSVAGVEKVVEKWEDAARILRVLPARAIGKRSTSYITVLGPKGPSSWREGREFHLVLIDNGRIGALENEWLGQTLRCIRCAACLDVCPTYRILGGGVFGDIYVGAMGVLWTAITNSVQRAAEIARYCVSCSLCHDVCPARIEIPLAISWIKHQGRAYTLRERMLTMYESYALLGSRMARLFNWLQENKSARRLVELVLGLDRRRLMHRFRGGDLYRVLGPAYLERSDADVVYFPDTYATYIDWSIGVLSVRVLERLGYRVALVKTQGSGMPAIQYGLHHVAKRIGEKNVARLAAYAERGAWIVCSEPTAAYCLANAYPKLLKTSTATEVAESTRELMSFIASEAKLPAQAKASSGGSQIFYHYPCHSRLVAPGTPSADLLSSLGLEVRTRDYGCCGIAGTWGMRRAHEGYSVSSEIGRRIAREVLKTNCSEVATESSVCALQLRQFTGLRVYHTVRYLAEALGIADRGWEMLNF
jgi:L-lactate dehydrogenase complex protein LldF